MIAANRDILAAVLLDIVMPEMDGYAVLENMGKIELLSRIPVLMITADTSPDAERTSYQKGAMDVISKPFDAVIVNQRVNRAIELYDHKNHLEDRVNEQTRVLRKQFMVLKKQEERLREADVGVRVAGADLAEVDDGRQRGVGGALGRHAAPDVARQRRVAAAGQLDGGRGRAAELDGAGGLGQDRRRQQSCEREYQGDAEQCLHSRSSSNRSFDGR